MILECRFKVVTLQTSNLRELVCLSDKRIKEAPSGKPVVSRGGSILSSVSDESIRGDRENLMAFAASPGSLVDYRSMT